MKTALPHWCRIVRETVVQYKPGAVVREAADVFRLVGDRAALEEVEVFNVLLLNGRNRLLALQEVSRGSATAALVHPREVFRLAVAMGAATVILHHNHPSGDPEPSAEDRALTERLRQAGELLGIRVLDHVVTGGARFHSFGDNGSV